MSFKKIIIFISIIIIFEFIYFQVLRKIENDEIKSYLIEKTDEINSKTISSINVYNIVSEIIFNQKINQSNVLALFSKAYNADSLEQKIIRDSINKILIPSYKQLLKYHIKQIQFDLPNNVRFLSINSPSKYGDDLSRYRYSVRMANKTNKRYKGFEEGKVLNGFRYVFPLSYKNIHIGTVETSFSFEAINDQLKNLGIYKANIILQKDLVFNNIFSDEHINYVKSILSDDYVYEKEYSHDKNNSTKYLKQIDIKIEKQVSKLLPKNENFTVYTKLYNDYYVVTFISLKNIEGKHVAYIVTYLKDKSIGEILRKHNILLLIGLLVIPFIIILLLIYIDGNRKLKFQNKNLIKTREKIEQTNQELEQINTTKDKFFSIISHDLKNPFNTLIGFSELLLTNFNDFSEKERLVLTNKIYEVSKRTFELLENLLNWSRIQKGKIKTNIIEINLQENINDVIELLIITANNKKISIKNEIDDNIRITADKLMIETVFRNLISNSIKFSYIKGEIIISAIETPDLIKIYVADNGIGIEEKNLKNLFKFDKLTSTIGTDGEKGTGLGLMLCKEFIELNNGKISVESQINKGTKFTIELPKSIQ